MSVRTSLYGCVVLALVLLAPAARAEERRGELIIRDWVNTENTVNIPLIKVRYTLSIFFGEPIKSFIFYYEPIDDFTRIHTIKMTAQVTVDGVPQDAYMDMDPLVGVPYKWGWDVPGSPDWDELFHSASGGPISEEEAKGFFRRGLSLTDLEIVEIRARSGVNDAEYEEFAAFLPASYVAEADELWPLDVLLPGDAFTYGHIAGVGAGQTETGNLWWTRLTSSDRLNQFARVTQENEPDGVYVSSIDHETWKYGDYQHAYIQVSFSEAGEPEHAQRVAIAIAWDDWSTGKTVRDRTYTQLVAPGQRMTVVDRVRRAEREDGSLAHYHVRYRVRYLPADEETEDPLAEADAEDRLLAALEADQAARYDAETARRERAVSAVYADHEQEKQRREAEAEARRLAQEQRRIEREAQQAQAEAAKRQQATPTADADPSERREPAIAKTPAPAPVVAPPDADYFVVLSMVRHVSQKDSNNKPLRLWPWKYVASVSKLFEFTVDDGVVGSVDVDTLQEMLIYRAWRDVQEFFGSEDLLYEHLDRIHFSGYAPDPWSSERRRILREQSLFVTPSLQNIQNFYGVETGSIPQFREHQLRQVPGARPGEGGYRTQVAYVDHSRIFDSRRAAEAFLAEQRAVGFAQRDVGGKVHVSDSRGLRRDDAYIEQKTGGGSIKTLPPADHPYPTRLILRNGISTDDRLSGNSETDYRFTLEQYLGSGASF